MSAANNSAPLAYRLSYVSWGSDVTEHYCADHNPHALGFGHVVELHEPDGWTIGGPHTQRCQGCGRAIELPVTPL